MITATDITCAYNGTVVLNGVGLLAEPGHVVGLIGPNGSGKTTLLRTLYAALTPRAGAITLDNQPLTTLSGRDLSRRIAVVAQDNTTELPLTVADMVLLGRSPHRSALRAYTTADHRKAAEALHRVGARHLADRRIASLSGGEKQRALIARALAQDTDHLLLDEPTNHLDIHYQHETLNLVRTLEVTTIVVLHDLNLAARYCDHLVLLDEGNLARSGPPETVLTPETLEPIYHVGVRRLTDDDCIQLIFRPRDRGNQQQSTQQPDHADDQRSVGTVRTAP